MAGSIENSRNVLRGANEDIAELDREIGRYLDSMPFEGDKSQDPVTALVTYKMKLTKKLPHKIQRGVSHIAGDLRAALDQLGYAAASASGSSRLKYTSFPFAKDASKFEDVIRGRCKDIPPNIVDVFRTFNPYFGGDDILWSLNEINNCHKHRVVLPIGSVIGQSTLMASHVVIQGPWHWPPRWDSSKGEVILFVTKPGSPVDCDYHFDMHVAFGEIPAIKEQPVVTVLNELAEKVEKIIDATFDAGIKSGIFLS